MENWREVEYNGFRFIVSDQGRIKRPQRTITKTRVRLGKTQTFDSIEPEKLLPTPLADGRGYKEVSVRVDGVRKRFPVHRLVAKAFCDGYEQGLHVDHINGNKGDNRACNLEWVTNEENVSRAWRSGIHHKLTGEANPSSVLTQKQVRIIRRLLLLGASSNMLGELLGVNPEVVRRIANGTSWKSVF